MFDRIVVERLRLLPRSPGWSDSQKKLIFLSELAYLGFLVSNPDDYNDSLLEHYPEKIETLRSMRGANTDYVPLFSGFPNQVPDGREYFVERLIGRAINFCHNLASGVRLDSGMRIPSWLFDLKQFGADPITQLQDRFLHRQSLELQSKRERDSHREWITLTIADLPVIEEKARAFLLDSLRSKSSIPEFLRKDLTFLLKRYPDVRPRPEEVTFKETRTFLTQQFWDSQDYEQCKDYLETPTDILRLFAALTKSDVSLAQPIRYPKLSRPQRRIVLEVLEKSSQVAEDLNRYRGLWLKIGKGLHPGELAAKYPKTAQAFADLRKGPIQTYNSRLEPALQESDVNELRRLLVQRPGVFARRLHQVLEVCPELLADFALIADQVAFKNLLMMQSHFGTIERAKTRAIFTKGGRIRVLPNRPGRLEPEVLAKLQGNLQETLLAKIGRDKPSWEGRRIWVDEDLHEYAVPLQLRKASDGLLVLGRGTRLPLDAGKVLRLFVYWKEQGKRTDLDLSVVQFDDAMNYQGHVSYTQLASHGIVHSGDVQSAPLGAAEFIDCDLSKLREISSCRYLAPQIYRYCGSTFAQLTCHAGWMIREKVDAKIATFDVKTIQNKFNLDGDSSYALPILVDLHESKIVYIDLYVGAAQVNNRLEEALQDLSTITQAMSQALRTRPNLYQLALLQVSGRGGTLVSEAEQADFRIGLQDCDLSFRDSPMKVLAEFL